jgi:hypothetical protein
MAENLTPRQTVRRLLQGISPPRPLFLPIVFSLGARVENLPLRAFLGNPTKISNSLRQIRSHLRSDGVACYFDPVLEAEALGAALHWTTEDQPPSIEWPQRAMKGELPQGLRSPKEAAKSGRVAVAVEVIRRLKSLLRDDPLLMAGVTGPFTLAARLTQMDRETALRKEDLTDAALEIAASVTTQIASAFVEAGANLIFIQEEILPPLSAENCEAWASLLAPTINIIRFYEALPVLQLSNSSSFASNSDVIFQQHWDCLLCPALEISSANMAGRFPESRTATLGIGLPLEAFQPEESGSKDLDPFLRHAISEWRPALLTTAGDLPATIDRKCLIKTLDNISRTIRANS